MSRLGRNPFEKKPVRAIDIVREEVRREEMQKKEPKVEIRPEPKSLREFFGHLTVDLRAESYILGLKIYLLAIALTE